MLSLLSYYNSERIDIVKHFVINALEMHSKEIINSERYGLPFIVTRKFSNDDSNVDISIVISNGKPVDLCNKKNHITVVIDSLRITTDIKKLYFVLSEIDKEGLYTNPYFDIVGYVKEFDRIPIIRAFVDAIDLERYEFAHVGTKVSFINDFFEFVMANLNEIDFWSNEKIDYICNMILGKLNDYGCNGLRTAMQKQFS